MDFDLSEEQRLLKDSVEGLLKNDYDFDARKKYGAEKDGWSRAIWGKLAEQGLLGLPFAEDDGGFGAGSVETMIVMEALGRALVLEPYLPSVILAGGFLRRGASAEQKAKYLPGLIDGSTSFAFAQLEKKLALRPRRRRHHRQEERRRLCDRRREIRGAERRQRRRLRRHRAHHRRPARPWRNRRVPGAGRCQGHLARRATRPRTGCTPPISASPASRSAPMRRSAIPATRLPLIERVVDDARAALCAEAVGAMEESLKTTVEYLKTRSQFGVPIGCFQVLQHRAADMFVALEQARSMAMFATMAGDSDDAKERATAIAAAKVQVGRSLKFVGEQAIQLHGGIGMTMEVQDRPLLQARSP